MNRRTTIALSSLTAVLLIASTASAAGPPTPWTTKDMKTAIRAISYPKPHPVKLTCKGLGAADSSGRFTSFRCTATYRHHVRRRFVIAGQGEGGWLCAGKSFTACAVLRHGFVTTAAFANGGVQGSAEIAAVGYMQNRYGIGVPNRKGLCTQAGATAWTCGYWTGTTTSVNVTVTLKAANGGYLTTATVQ